MSFCRWRNNIWKFKWLGKGPEVLQSLTLFKLYKVRSDAGKILKNKTHAFYDFQNFSFSWSYLISSRNLITLQNTQEMNAVSREFQTSFISCLFPKRSVYLPVSSRPPFRGIPGWAHKCWNPCGRPALDYLVHIAEPACVFFLSMGHFIATYLNSWKELTLSVGDPTLRDVCICVFFAIRRLVWGWMSIL